jgi:hypothetical protein
MGFCGICKRGSIIFFVLSILWAVASPALYGISLIIILLSGVLSLLLYGIGEIVDNLRTINTHLIDISSTKTDE